MFSEFKNQGYIVWLMILAKILRCGKKYLCMKIKSSGIVVSPILRLWSFLSCFTPVAFVVLSIITRSISTSI